MFVFGQHRANFLVAAQVAAVVPSKPVGSNQSAPELSLPIIRFHSSLINFSYCTCHMLRALKYLLPISASCGLSRTLPSFPIRTSSHSPRRHTPSLSSPPRRHLFL